VFLMVEGASAVRLEEMRGFSGLVFLGTQFTAWLLLMVEELMWFPSDKSLSSPLGRVQKFSSFEEVVTNPAGSWRWRFTQWVAGEGSF